MKRSLILLLGLALTGAGLSRGLAADAAAAQSAMASVKETPRQHNARMRWWRHARFGMFIHWGIYAVPAQGEWFLNNSHMPLKQYEKYAQQFDPVHFNAAKWVQIAKQAGMKYIVITSKHHDGFCMFNTTATHYNVVDDTPWHHDPLKDLSEQCRKQGIKFCVYYSIMDWHSPDQMPAKPDPVHPTYNPTRIRPGHKAAYVKYMKTELHELITQYHPAVIWFDGGWPSWWTANDGKELYAWLRHQDRHLIINNREKGAGDFGTPEQHIPATGNGQDWETCMTINNNWGYNASDHHFKSTTTLLHNLIDIASKGGNYLLNVGPTDEGIIPQPEVDRLEGMGRWLKVNGAAIYGSQASPFRHLSWGRCTQRRGRLYLEVFDWPQNGRLEVPLHNRVRRAFLLADKSQHLKVEDTPNGKVILVPAKMPTPPVGVIVLEIHGKPEVAESRIHQASNGTLTLNAADAQLKGSSIQVETKNGIPNIGFWTDASDYVQWPVVINKAGTFDVLATFACAPGSEGSDCSLIIGDQQYTTAVPATGGWNDFQTQTMGPITVDETGPVNIMVKADDKPGLAVVNLRSLVLRPVD